MGIGAAVVHVDTLERQRLRAAHEACLFDNRWQQQKLAAGQKAAGGSSAPLLALCRLTPETDYPWCTVFELQGGVDLRVQFLRSFRRDHVEIFFTAAHAIVVRDGTHCVRGLGQRHWHVQKAADLPMVCNPLVASTLNPCRPLLDDLGAFL